MAFNIIHLNTLTVHDLQEPQPRTLTEDLRLTDCDCLSLYLRCNNSDRIIYLEDNPYQGKRVTISNLEDNPPQPRGYLKIKSQDKLLAILPVGWTRTFEYLEGKWALIAAN